MKKRIISLLSCTLLMGAMTSCGSESNTAPEVLEPAENKTQFSQAIQTEKPSETPYIEETTPTSNYRRASSVDEAIKLHYSSFDALDADLVCCVIPESMLELHPDTPYLWQEYLDSSGLDKREREITYKILSDDELDEYYRYDTTSLCSTLKKLGVDNVDNTWGVGVYNCRGINKTIIVESDGKFYSSWVIMKTIALWADAGYISDEDADQGYPGLILWLNDNAFQLEIEEREALGLFN